MSTIRIISHNFGRSREEESLTLARVPASDGAILLLIALPFSFHFYISPFKSLCNIFYLGTFRSFKLLAYFAIKQFLSCHHHLPWVHSTRITRRSPSSLTLGPYHKGNERSPLSLPPGSCHKGNEKVSWTFKHSSFLCYPRLFTL